VRLLVLAPTATRRRTALGSPSPTAAISFAVSIAAAMFTVSDTAAVVSVAALLSRYIQSQAEHQDQYQ
jgi:hypothetical protein